MIRRSVRLALVALPLALPACDLSAPVWSAEFLFPVDYPDVELADYAVAGEIPDIDLSFTSAPAQQDITGLLEEMLSDDLIGLTIEIITEATVDVTASLTLNIATSGATPPPPSSSISVQIDATLGVDTTAVVVNPEALREAIALYYQTRGTLRGAPGGTPVATGDRIKVDVNLFATYRMHP